MSQKNNKSLADNFLVVIIGLIASCIGIFAFVTGKPDIFSIIEGTATPIPPTATLDASTEMLFETATAYASQRLKISKTDPSSWFPSQEAFPKEVYLEVDEGLSNENAAKLFTDPTAIYLDFQKWGRITGHHKIYYNQYRCESLRGIAYIEIQASLYSTPEGAKQDLEFRSQEYSKLITNSIQVKETFSVGNSGYIIQMNDINFCTLDDEGFRTARVFFERQGAFVYVQVSAVADTIPNDDVVTLAVHLAQYTDINLKQFSK